MLIHTKTEEVVPKHYRVHAYHDICGGEWFTTGSGTANSVGYKYEHRCFKCSERALLDSRFPRIETKYYSLDSLAL
jgi:hypothetical protein